MHFRRRNHGLFLPHPNAVNQGASRPFIFSSTFQMWKKKQHQRLSCRYQRSPKASISGKDEFALVYILWCFISLCLLKSFPERKEKRNRWCQMREESPRFLHSWLAQSSRRKARVGDVLWSPPSLPTLPGPGLCKHRALMSQAKGGHTGRA